MSQNTQYYIMRMEQRIVALERRNIELQRRLMEAEERDTAGKRIAGLMNLRQMQLVARLMKGLTYKEVAVLVGTTEQTIKNEVNRVFRVVGVNNLVQLLVFAYRHPGLLRAIEQADALPPVPRVRRLVLREGVCICDLNLSKQ